MKRKLLMAAVITVPFLYALLSWLAGCFNWLVVYGLVIVSSILLDLLRRKSPLMILFHFLFLLVASAQILMMIYHILNPLASLLLLFGLLLFGGLSFYFEYIRNEKKPKSEVPR